MGDQDKKDGAGKAADKQAMDAVANIAGHIAHDFNNLLTPMIAYPDLIRMDLPADCRANELLNVVTKAAQDMADIARQLLTASGRSQFSPEQVDINELVKAAVEQCSSECEDSETALVTSLGESLPSIHGTPEPIIELIRHLCTNAIDAEPSRVTVSTAAVQVDRSVGRFTTVDSGAHLRLAVTDDGKGMDEEGLAQMFDAFYTTKTKNAVRRTGLGLGMNVVYGIVTNQGAAIEITSSPGEGTTSAVYFPIEGACETVPLSKFEAGQVATGTSNAETQTPETPAAPESEAAAPAPQEDVPSDDDSGSNGSSVLIVDDEGGIRRLFQTILSTAFPDTRIDTAGDGAEAVEAFRANRYGVLLMDLHMPVMDGTTAFNEIAGLSRENNWRMPAVVFCTGFAPPVAVKEIVNQEDIHCLLTKPVSGDDLVSAVRDRLVMSRE